MAIRLGLIFPCKSVSPLLYQPIPAAAGAKLAKKDYMGWMGQGVGGVFKLETI